MNCQDISRIADTGHIRTLPPAERLAAEAHVRSCSRCAAVWSVHTQLLALDSPPMPAEVSLRLGAMAASPAGSRGRYALRRVTMVGGVMALAAAAGVLIWRMGGSGLPAPSAGADSVAVFPGDDARLTWDGGPAAALPLARAAAPAPASRDEAAMCAQIVNEVEQFATQEGVVANPDQSQERGEEWWRAEVEQLQYKAAGSDDPELFLTAALLDPPERRASGDPVARATLLDLGMRAAEARSPLLAWHALRACVEVDQSCPYEHVIPRLLEADRENAESWALLATLRHRRGDTTGALAAMQEAARAPTSTWYWAATIALVERQLAAVTALSSPERMAGASGAGASAGLPSQTHLRNMCRVESAKSPAWGQACLAFGTLRAERGGTVAERSFAYSLRADMLTVLGDTQLAAEVAAERALFEAGYLGGRLAPIGGLHAALTTSSPARTRAYLDAIEQFGEIEGVRVFLRQQLPLLLQRAGLLEREGARECMAQFFVPRVAAGTRAAAAGYLVQVADEMLVSVRGGLSLEAVVRVRPDGTFMMPLSAAATTGRTTAEDLEARIAASGRPTRPLQQEVVALGKTMEQLQQEIATLLTRRDRTPEVLVIPLAPRSREQLQLEFDQALREAVQ